MNDYEGSTLIFDDVEDIFQKTMVPYLTTGRPQDSALFFFSQSDFDLPKRIMRPDSNIIFCFVKP